MAWWDGYAGKTAGVAAHREAEITYPNLEGNITNCRDATGTDRRPGRATKAAPGRAPVVVRVIVGAERDRQAGVLEVLLGKAGVKGF